MKEGERERGRGRKGEGEEERGRGEKGKRGGKVKISGDIIRKKIL